MSASEIRGSETGKSADQTADGSCRVDITNRRPGRCERLQLLPPKHDKSPCPPPPVACPTGPIAPGSACRSPSAPSPSRASGPSSTRFWRIQGAERHRGRLLPPRAPIHGWAIARQPFEQSAFQLFGSLSPELRSILSCSVASFDAIPRSERNRLFDPTLPTDVSTPLDGETLATAFLQEIKQRVSLDVFQNEVAVEQERPAGTASSSPRGSSSTSAPCLQAERTPHQRVRARPSAGDFLPSELQHTARPW